LVMLYVAMCDDFIAYGSRAKKYLIALGANPAAITIYYNSVDVDYFHEKSVQFRRERMGLRKKYAIPQGDNVILFVGQLVARKGVSELARAFRLLHEPKTTLVVVGNGPLRDTISGKSIVQISHREYDRLPEIYAMSDVLILPSVQEVWGLVVNEAMASGLPVLVSSRAGCAPDVVRNGVNGFTFEPSERGILSVLTRYLTLTKSRRIHMGNEAYKTIKALYDKSIYQK